MGTCVINLVIFMKLIKNISLLLVGGLLYYFIEVLYRGHSHYSMFFVGGICFFLIGLLNEFYTWDMAFVSQMFLSSIIITIVEFISGCILNIWLGLNVWSYYHMPYNLLGQVCLLFSILWFFLSAIGILLDDWLRYFIWKEEKPHYKWL